MIGLTRRRMSRKEEELIVTTSFIGNNRRISGVSNGNPTYYTITSYCVIKINLSKAIKGKITINQGTGQGSSYTLFYVDDTYVSRISSSPNPNTISLTNPCNRILIGIHKTNRSRAYIKFENGKNIWTGADEDWSRWGI